MMTATTITIEMKGTAVAVEARLQRGGGGQLGGGGGSVGSAGAIGSGRGERLHHHGDRFC
jgi:hypothetical protein